MIPTRKVEVPSIMFILFFLVFIVNWLSTTTEKHLEYCYTVNYGNLIIIKPTESGKGNATDTSHVDSQGLKPQVRRLTYKSNELHALGQRYHDDPRHRILPFGAIKTIRQLRINKKKGKGTTLSRKTTPMGININNLIHITPVDEHDIEVHNFLQIATINVRSLKSKDHLVVSEIISGNLDAVLITETWLTKDDHGWAEACQLNQNALSLSYVNRVNKRGGGLALVTKNEYKATLEHEHQDDSFESAVWSLDTSPKVHIVGIYRPLAASSIIEFTDKFSDYYMETVDTYSNTILIGDFNIHVNDLESNEVLLFNQTIEALGLNQHVTQPTHQKGNILDLIITNVTSKYQPTAIKIGNYLSDHAVVIMELNVKKSLNSLGKYYIGEF